jgi:alpha-tubulin suppressor-like RCC1 family protein
LYVPDGLSNVVAIAAGFEHSLALGTDGRVAGWGDDFIWAYGPMGDMQYWAGQATAPEGLSNVVAIAAGGYHNLGLTTAGQVIGWGYNYPDWYWVQSGEVRGRTWSGQATPPPGLNDVTAIAAGYLHSLAQTAEGHVVAWGYNEQGQTNVPGGLADVVAIAAGGNHSLALKSDGRVVGWGSYGGAIVPGGLSNVVAIAAGYYHSLALTTDGRVVAWGENGSGQTNVPSGLSGVVAIAAGGWHNLALTVEGRVVAWGGNYSPATNVPSGLTNTAAVAAGGTHNLALIQQGSVPEPGLELSRGVLGLELRARGAPGISCQLLRASTLAGPWLPTQPVTFTNEVQLLRAPGNSALSQFFRLLRN